MIKKNLAFTLAETLIVMGIIGVVAALTLPNLNSSTGDKEKVAKVKKIYENLNDAYGRAEAVYGPYSDWFLPTDNTPTLKAKRAGERITEFLKVSKPCENTANTVCMAGALKFDGSANQTDYSTANYYKVITADGTSIAIGGDTAANIIGVDIDGPTKGNHTNGKDIFMFVIDPDVGLIPKGGEPNETFSNIIKDIYTDKKAEMASAWVIKYDNMDYLKFSGVSGATATCTNGTANGVTESNPRCK